MSLRVLEFRPGERKPTFLCVDGTIPRFTELLGNFINFIPIHCDRGEFLLMFNPEAKERGFPPNRIINGRTIYGNFLLYDARNEETDSSGDILTHLQRITAEWEMVRA